MWPSNSYPIRIDDVVSTDSENLYMDIRINLPSDGTLSDCSYLYATQKLTSTTSSLMSTIKNVHMKLQSADVTAERHLYPIVTNQPRLLDTLHRESAAEDVVVVIPCLCSSIIATAEKAIKLPVFQKFLVELHLTLERHSTRTCMKIPQNPLNTAFTIVNNSISTSAHTQYGGSHEEQIQSGGPGNQQNTASDHDSSTRKSQSSLRETSFASCFNLFQWIVDANDTSPLNDFQMQCVRISLLVFKILNSAVVLLSDKHDHLTASMILSFLQRLCEQLHQLLQTTFSRPNCKSEACHSTIDHSSGIAYKFVHFVCEQLGTLYTGSETLHKTLILAALTDPRVESSYLQEQRMSCRCSGAKQHNSTIACGAEKFWMHSSMIPKGIIPELEKRNAMTPVRLHDDVFNWWSIHAGELPTLAALAPQHLTIPATAYTWRTEFILPSISSFVHFNHLLEFISPKDLPLCPVWLHSPAANYFVQRSLVQEDAIPEYHFLLHNWKFMKLDDLRDSDSGDQDDTLCATT